MGCKPTRPLLRYHGGKWRLAEWIISHFPQHRMYVEPFGGSGSVLLQKRASWGEIYNDLDGEIVNLFRVLRNQEDAQKLIHQLELTPYSRNEYNLSFEPDDEPVEQARRTIVRSLQGFGSSMMRPSRSGFLKLDPKTGSYVNSWARYPEQLKAIIERLRRVSIEQLPALELLQKYDAPEVLFYCDPPYTHDERTSANTYRHEMDNAAHRALAEVLHQAKGFVVLSGYPSDLYDELYGEWESFSVQSTTVGGRLANETIWLNPNTSKALESERLPLFQMIQY